MKSNLLSSDAWVLLASIYAGQGKPASLASVIAAADYIQHAVPLFEEIEGALARLTGAGHISFQNGSLVPSQGVLAYYQSITKPRRSVHAELADVAKFLHAEPWKPEAVPQQANVGAAFPALSREVFNQAVASYIGRVA